MPLGLLSQNLFWSKLGPFSLILFFILLGDALLSYWVPNFLQKALGSPLKMGVIMGFSSLVGLLADLIIPQTLKGFSVRKLLLWAILSSLIFAFCLLLGVKFPLLIIFLGSMAVWGVYYEFLHFSQAQFVADSLPLKVKTSGWAVIGIFKNLAYFLGPLIAGLTLLKSDFSLLLIAVIFISIGLGVFLITKKEHHRPIAIETQHISIFREISYWKVLFKRIWPVIVLSLFMGLIDATFWTTGAVWSERLSKENVFATLLLPAYQLPSLFMGFVLARWKIYKGKKRLSEKSLLICGLFLSLLYFNFPVPVYIFIVFISSIYFAIALPLVEAVYSDVIARMGIERKHLVGLSASAISLAYIIGPAISGLIANYLQEKNTIAAIGIIAAIVSLVLLFITPKKLRLPESEIAKWNKS